LRALQGSGPQDLVDKAASLVGLLLELLGVSGGKAVALEVLRSGKALAKMREIIAEQGGDPGVEPEDIPIGDKKLTVRAERDGAVTWINNSAVAMVARLAGAPKDKGAGVELHVKLGDSVREGDPLFTVYSEHSAKLQAAEDYITSATIVQVSKPGADMLLKSVVEPLLPAELTLAER